MACGPQGQGGLVALAPQAGLPCFPYLGDNTQELGLRGPELENKDHAAEIISFFIYQGRESRSNQPRFMQTNKAHALQIIHLCNEVTAVIELYVIDMSNGSLATNIWNARNYATLD